MVCVIHPPHLSSLPPYIIVIQFLSSAAAGLFPITEAVQQDNGPQLQRGARLPSLLFELSHSSGSRRAGRAWIHPRLESSISNCWKKKWLHLFSGFPAHKYVVLLLFKDRPTRYRGLDLDFLKKGTRKKKNVYP